MLSPFPYIERGISTPQDGSYLSVPLLCQNCKPGTCSTFYNEVIPFPGYHVCPGGFSAYVRNGNDVLLVGLRIGGHFKKSKLKGHLAGDYRPLMKEKVFQDILERHEKSIGDAVIYSRYHGFFKETIHGIRRHNGIIKSLAEKILKTIEKNPDVEEIEDLAGTVFALASLTSVRLDTYDSEMNPGRTYHSKGYIEPYKRFDKAQRCLRKIAKEKEVRINLTGTCRAAIEGYDIFDNLPFLLIENAVKYSPRNGMVEVIIEEEKRTIVIKVISEGPAIEKDEKEKIYQRGYRGKNAKAMTDDGAGIGLYHVKQICDMHDIRIELETSGKEMYLSDGVPMATIAFVLKINKK